MSPGQRRALEWPVHKPGRNRKAPGYTALRNLLLKIGTGNPGGALNGWLQAHPGEFG